MSAEFDQENLTGIFLAEAQDGMASLKAALDPPDGGVPGPEQLHEQFIVAHRIRGGGATLWLSWHRTAGGSAGRDV